MDRFLARARIVRLSFAAPGISAAVGVDVVVPAVPDHLDAPVTLLRK